MASRKLRLLRAKRQVQLIVLAAVAVGAFISCKPVPGRIAGAGDSIGYNIKEDYKEPWSQTVDSNFFPGAKAGNILPWVRDIVNDPDRSPSCIIIEFGQNEASDGVITSQEKSDLFQIVYTPDKASRTVLILPHRVGGTPEQLSALEQWRTYLHTLVLARPNSVEVDLRPLFTEHPEYLRDGVHLSSLEAASAVADLMRGGCSTQATK